MFAGIVSAALFSLMVSACGGSTAAEGQWSGPTTVAGKATLVDVSCPTSSSCVAVDGRDNSVRFMHGRWFFPVPITGAGSSGNASESVSCGAATVCAAALSSGALPIFDGTVWSGSRVVDSDGTPTSVSCPTSRFCIAVDNAGEALTFNGTWSAPIDVDNGGDLASVSCTSPTFCLAVSADTPATAYRFNGERWSSVAAPSPSTPQGGSEPDVLSSVSCANPTYCVALDDFGEAFSWSGRAWSTPILFDDVQDGTDAVSCPVRNFCMIVDGNGVAMTFTDGSVGPRRQLVSGAGGLNSVSCATAAQCVAVGEKGSIYTFTSGTKA
jgi:hypothetical protein